MPRPGTSCRKAERPEADARRAEEVVEQHQGEFDYLLGDWEFTSVDKQYRQGPRLLERRASG